MYHENNYYSAEIKGNRDYSRLLLNSTFAKNYTNLTCKVLTGLRNLLGLASFHSGLRGRSPRNDEQTTQQTNKQIIKSTDKE